MNSRRAIHREWWRCTQLKSEVQDPNLYSTQIWSPRSQLMNNKTLDLSLMVCSHHHPWNRQLKFQVWVRQFNPLLEIDSWDFEEVLLVYHILLVLIRSRLQCTTTSDCSVPFTTFRWWLTDHRSFYRDDFYTCTMYLESISCMSFSESHRVEVLRLFSLIVSYDVVW